MSDELTLLDIESGLIALHDQLEECESAEQEQQVLSAMEAYVRAEVQKVDSVRAWVMDQEARRELAEREAKKQYARAKMYENRIARIKEFCLKVLQENQLQGGKTKLEGRTGVIRMQKNGGKVPLEIFDETALPTEYTPMVITYPPDTEAIRKALEAGTHVPGAKLLARGVHCRIE